MSSLQHEELFESFKGEQSTSAKEKEPLVREQAFKAKEHAQPQGLLGERGMAKGGSAVCSDPEICATISHPGDVIHHPHWPRPTSEAASCAFKTWKQRTRRTFDREGYVVWCPNANRAWRTLVAGVRQVAEHVRFVAHHAPDVFKTWTGLSGFYENQHIQFPHLRFAIFQRLVASEPVALLYEATWRDRFGPKSCGFQTHSKISMKRPGPVETTLLSCKRHSAAPLSAFVPVRKLHRNA